MNKFKSFESKKYSKSVKYNKCLTIGLSGSTKKMLKKLCINCGYPFGEHFVDSNKCPIKKEVKKYLKPVKHTGNES